MLSNPLSLSLLFFLLHFFSFSLYIYPFVFFVIPVFFYGRTIQHTFLFPYAYIYIRVFRFYVESNSQRILESRDKYSLVFLTYFSLWKKWIRTPVDTNDSWQELRQCCSFKFSLSTHFVVSSFIVSIRIAVRIMLKLLLLLYLYMI